MEDTWSVGLRGGLFHEGRNDAEELVNVGSRDFTKGGREEKPPP